MSDLGLNTVVLGNTNDLTSLTTTDNGDSVGRAREGLDNGDRTLDVGRPLELAHRTVPDDSVGTSESLSEDIDGLLTDIEAEDAIREGGDGVVHRDLARDGRILELLTSEEINGENKLSTSGSSLVEDGLGNSDGLLVNVGDVESLSLEEGESHGTADEDLISDREEVAEDRELGINLSTTENGSEGVSRDAALRNSLGEVLDLLAHQETGDARDLLLALGSAGAKSVGHADDGGVGTVSSTEGIVDVDVHVDGVDEGIDEGGVVLLLTLVETEVVEEEDGARLEGGDGLLDGVTNAVVDEGDRDVELLTDDISSRSEAERSRVILGITKVRSNDDLFKGGNKYARD